MQRVQRIVELRIRERQSEADGAGDRTLPVDDLETGDSGLDRIVEDQGGRGRRGYPECAVDAPAGVAE
jgi:hypothetical protein